MRDKTLMMQQHGAPLAADLLAMFSPDSWVEVGSTVSRYCTDLVDADRNGPFISIDPASKFDQMRHNPALEHFRIDIFSDNHPQRLNHKFELVVAFGVTATTAKDQFVSLLDFLVSRCSRWLIFSARYAEAVAELNATLPSDLDWRTAIVHRGMRFDQEKTTALRTQCSRDQRAGHFQDLMVFETPRRYAPLASLEQQAKPYLQDITALVMQHGDFLEGNLFYVDLQQAINGMPQNNLREKRVNFMQMVQGRDQMLEIGFNAGHSALLALLANPECRIQVVDICAYPYIEPCYRYLSKMFPGRLSMIKGDSTKVLPAIKDQKFNLIHYDGGKSRTIGADLNATRGLVNPDHILIIDDTQSRALTDVVNRYVEAGIVDTSVHQNLVENLRWYKWKHSIARFVDTAEKT